MTAAREGVDHEPNAANAEGFGRGRILLARFAEGGVVLDLATGDYHELNAAASLVCASLLEGAGIDGATCALVRAFGISTARGRRDAVAFAKALRAASPAPRLPTRDPLQFELLRGEPWALWQGRTVARIDPFGEHLVWEDVRGVPCALVLSRLAPQLLTLRGVSVLHASAVERHGAAYAVTGPSASGKSTLARLVSRHGASALATDLVVLDLGRHPAVVVGAEQAVARWVAANARRCTPGARVDARSILAGTSASSSPLTPIAAVLALDEDSRQGEAFTVKPLETPAAMAALLKNAFAEVPLPRAWSTAFVLAERLASAGIVGRLTTPSGLSRQRRALRQTLEIA